MPYDTSYDAEIDRLKKEINIYECQKHRQEEITGRIKKYIDACKALTDEATARQAVEIRSSAV